MKRKILSIIYILLTFIITTLVVSLILINSDKFLKSFSIISVENISSKYTIKFENVKAASYYDIIIYNEDNSLFYNKKVYITKNTINLSNIEYNKKYKMVIFAYDKVGDSISVNNPYSFTYNDPTFDADNNLVLESNKDYELKIKGNLFKKNYTIKIYDNKNLVKTDNLTRNYYIIPNNLYSNQTKELVAKIYDSLNEINSITLYSNKSPVSDLKITSPNNNDILDYSDVTFTYEGGTNATKYLLQIYKDNDLLKETSINKNRCVISSEFFNKSENYTIKINALYKDYTSYTKSASVSFTMNEKDTLKPAYIDKYYKHVKEGTNITLNNPNSDGTIYYTTDGSDPNNGAIYKDPIVITKNMTIKAIIKEPKKNDSIVSTFDINMNEKENYKVYLSPSNQTGNIGVTSVGYSNEGKEMNDISNYIEKRLEKYNVKVYRNNINGNINIWNSDSKYYGCDIHIAIHSNASDDGHAYGIETWINEQTSEAYSLANLVQNNLMSIYYKADGDGNRGVKYANGALGEVNEDFVPFGLLVETAYHDYKEDAQWLMVNKKLIGNTIADTILKYFGII